MERVLDWLDDQTQISKDAAVLDLGCGNGVMLIELVSCRLIIFNYLALFCKFDQRTPMTLKGYTMMSLS